MTRKHTEEPPREAAEDDVWQTDAIPESTEDHPAPDDDADGGDDAEGDGVSQADAIDQSEGNPNREAARYRTRLREVESERDELAGRLDGLLRGQAEALATGGEARLHSGADLWLDGGTVADVVGEDGQVDPERVAALAQAVAQARPYLRTNRWSSGGDGGPRGGGKPRVEPRLGAIFAQSPPP
jgi:hypothetical protein